ncbi:rod shape-determining protein [Candidatus Saccharibacteria bacterium CPR2]|nr:rod shape-determining protein [Candidatus Saccharibacteria bacterium CPR2]
MAIFSKKIGIDLGTSRTRIYIPRKGIIVDEPSVVAKNTENDKIVAVGLDAIDMLGRTPEQLEAYYPLQNGVIADFGAAEQMLRNFVQKAIGRFHIQKPEAMITVSVSATSTEQRAVLDVGHEAGIQNVFLIYSPVAAALGASIPVIEPKGHMIVDIGSGTTEIAVLSLGGIVTKEAVRVGGKAMDEAITRYFRRTHNMHIGLNTAEETKLKIGAVHDEFDDQKMTVRGRNLSDSLPKSVDVKGRDLRPHLEGVFDRIILAVRNAIERTPPDVVSDIVGQGIVLSGGVAQLNGIEEYLSRKLNTPCFMAQDPLLCNAKGTYYALSHLDEYKRSLLGL